MEHRGSWGTGAIFAFCFLLAGAAPASAYDVTDPQGLLPKLDTFLAGSTFDTAFKLGDTASGTRLHKDCWVSCGTDGCGSVCSNVSEPLSRKVTVLTSDEATIELDDGTTQLWSRAQFASASGNAVRQDLPTLDFQTTGTLEASELNDKPYTLGSQTLNCKEIVFLFHPSADPSATFKIRYVVSRDLPLAGQIVQTAAFGFFMYKLDSVVRP